MAIVDCYDNYVWIGTRIKIIYMMDEPDYSGRIGEVLEIDNSGHLFGTWGDEPIMPSIDAFVVV